MPTARTAPDRKTYVLDTSVLLAAGSSALRAFDEHEVVLPLVVITELEGKRNDPEIGWIARDVLRALEDYRLTAADKGLSLRESDGIEVNDQGGTLRIELNHVDQSGLPDALKRSGSHDVRILAVAHGLQCDNEPRKVVVVSRDLPMRLLAGGVLGLAAEDYRNDQAIDTGYMGIEFATLTKSEMGGLYAKDGDNEVTVEIEDVPINTGVVLDGYEGGGAVGIVSASTKTTATVRRVRDQDAFGLKAHSAEQKVALDHLLNPEIGIVSLGGRAGTGKSVLAIAAGLEAVMERRQQKKIIVFRPMYSVGGQDLGFLPGTAEEKMDPWAAAVFDALGSLASKDVLDEIHDRQLIEVLPLTHIRGRTLHEAWIVVDEAQNLERPTLMAALSRLGKGSKVVLTHDVSQRDNLHVGRHDGIATVVDRLKGQSLFAHVTLTRSERSEVAELVTRLLDVGE